jgi:pimeloyl-ACP methyl ester carboxylesterase
MSGMRLLLRLLALSLLIAPIAARAQITSSVVDLTPRPGITLRVLIETPAQPTRAVILFNGGPGIVTIDNAGKVTWGHGNFLIRSRQNWSGYGFLVAVVDAPSDWQKPSEGLGMFRYAQAHADDIAQVIQLVRSRVTGSVWLVGTSRGTISAANAAIRLKSGGPDGIVLTSSMVSTRGRDDLFIMDLAQIRVPVLIVHHRDDGCIAAAPGMVPRLADALVNAPKREVMMFEGGAPSRSDPCEPWAPHGYIGIEGKVVGEIARWIKTNGP